MLALLLSASVLTASPPPAANVQPPRVASPTFNVINVDPKLAEFYAEHYAQTLSVEGLKVTTSREVQALLGMERQKQLLGCSDDASSCIAELAGALGVDALALGSLAKLGPQHWVLNVKMVSATSGETIAVDSAKLADEASIADALSTIGRSHAISLYKRLGRVRPVAKESGFVFKPWMAVAGASVVALAGSGGAFVGASNMHQRLEGQVDRVYGDARDTALWGGRYQQAGWILLGAGVLAGAGAGAWWFFGERQPASKLVWFAVPNGVGVAGVFP